VAHQDAAAQWRYYYYFCYFVITPVAKIPGLKMESLLTADSKATGAKIWLLASCLYLAFLLLAALVLRSNYNKNVLTIEVV